jgi:serine/threonine protein kinase/tetratricopeptide (TPR) repeat protein
MSMPPTLTCPNGHELPSLDAACPLCDTKVVQDHACPAAELELPKVSGYEILEELGRGGMGVVYKARQVSLNRLVALKMIRTGPSAGAEELARFKTEAEAVARLQHPNIVQIHEVGAHAGRPYFALEYVEGGSLAAGLTGTPLPARPAAELVEKLARAMQFAHEQGVIHRDLKPGNVLLQVQNAECRVQNDKPDSAFCILHSAFCIPKVTDFGLAKFLDRDAKTSAGATQTGAVLGTPSYMAPEQAWGKSKIRTIGPAVDVYALGAVLYEALTGRPPFRAATPLITLNQVCSEEPVLPGRLQPGLPRDLETICLKCLQKEPSRRFATARDLADDLHRFLSGEPVTARPTPVLERAVKWARRRPVAATILTAGTLAVLSLVAVSWAFTARLSLALEAEQQSKQVAEQRLVQLKKANEAERKSKRVAQRRLEQVKKANGVLGSIFRDLDWQADRTGGPGLRKQLTKRFQQAAAQLDSEAIADPLTAAGLQENLGSALAALGQPRQAIKLLQQALAVREARLGPKHIDTLESMTNLASAYQDGGQVAKALPLYRQLVARFKAKDGPDHRNTLSSMNNLADAFAQAGQLDKAFALHKQVLARRKALLAPDDFDLLMSMSNLAGMYYAAGRLAEGLPLYKELVPKFKAKLGPDHPYALIAMSNLAVAYHQSGQLAKALPLYQQVLALRKAKLGPDHPHTLRAMDHLAAAYKDSGRRAEALALFKQVLAGRQAKLGPDHPSTWDSMSRLASAYLADGQFPKALPLFEDVLTKQKARLGPNHPDTLDTMTGLATAYRHAGQLSQAVRLNEEVLAKTKAKFGPDHPRTLRTMNNLGLAYRDAGRRSEALSLWEQAAPKQKTKLGLDHPDTLASLHNLATAFEDAGQLPRAESLRREVLAGRRRKSGPKSPITGAALAKLGQNFIMQKKYDTAEPLLRESLTILARTQPESLDTFATRSLLGAALMGRKQYAQAEPLLLEGYRGLKKREAKIPTPDRPGLTKALDRLVRLYEAWGKEEQAKVWRTQQTKEAATKDPKP